MLAEERIALSKARLAVAKERVSFAEQILAIGDYKTVANRSYYAIFAAMRAVLALDGEDQKKHSGIIALFRKNYIKTGVFSRELSVMIDGLVEIRQGSDYDDFYLVTKAEVVEQPENAKVFVAAVEEYLMKRYGVH